MLRSLKSRRDVTLVLIGALSTLILSSLFDTTCFHSKPSTQETIPLPLPAKVNIPTHKHHQDINLAIPRPIELARKLPETTLVSHGPGWTIFENLYMYNGTLFVVTSKPSSSFPPPRLITSNGGRAENTPENIAWREPTTDDIAFITPAEAKTRWGDSGTRNRVMAVEGNTFLFNDPNQFIDHYYHFVAELWFGAWAIWSSTFASPSYKSHPQSQIHMTAPLHSSTFNYLDKDKQAPPHIHRAIFTHTSATEWRDKPRFNPFFLRAVFPSLTLETSDSWQDRINTTILNPEYERAYHFDRVLLADRSAAFRGDWCGGKVHRTASEAYYAMLDKGLISNGWWEPVRASFLRYARAPLGVKYLPSAEGKTPTDQMELMPEKVVITYISRQQSRRHLLPSSHESLVKSLRDLVTSRGPTWELNIMLAEQLTKEEQLAIIARTHILIGVHGNGLTHLIWMPPSRINTVIEIFYPGGFTHDYEWTARALGMKHFKVWNDTWTSYPTHVWVEYPEGFQGTRIPVHGPAIAKIVEDRVAGLLP